MRAGIAAMELLDDGVHRLDTIGEAVRGGMDELVSAMVYPAAPEIELGSLLLKVHFTIVQSRLPLAYPTEHEGAVFDRGSLDRGVLAVGYGLMALSTPMTDRDIDTVSRSMGSPRRPTDRRLRSQ